MIHLSTTVSIEGRSVEEKPGNEVIACEQTAE